ncbi:hypothetical protein [Ferrimicrobium sp.]|uniref:hypothetical protein n=1 Tax=Ferrimicrobium sp. TaxID=2926050 RepID=UPI00263A1114|nr:hypothetical protein [Ferrimicrobium sp.]
MLVHAISIMSSAPASVSTNVDLLILGESGTRRLAGGAIKQHRLADPGCAPLFAPFAHG